MFSIFNKQLQVLDKMMDLHSENEQLKRDLSDSLLTISNMEDRLKRIEDDINRIDKITEDTRATMLINMQSNQNVEEYMKDQPIRQLMAEVNLR